MSDPLKEHEAKVRAADAAHERVRELSTELILAVESAQRQSDQDCRLDGLALTLSEFREGLLRHLAWEECEGYLKPVMSRDPTRAQEVRHLREDHDRFRQAIDGLLQSVMDEARSPDHHVDELCSRVRAFLRELHLHEQREEALVRKVYYE
ncbi:MAG TPA: hemerythrin domain-containing protein [Planctomycetota bacterium]|nr:hemerythrin domain-containing protein [Planctomycetota bacterium]